MCVKMLVDISLAWPHRGKGSGAWPYRAVYRHALHMRKLDIKCYNPLIRHFLETVIGSDVHWLFEVKIFSWLWLPLWVKNRVQYILLSSFTLASYPGSFPLTGARARKSLGTRLILHMVAPMFLCLLLYGITLLAE